MKNKQLSSLLSVCGIGFVMTAVNAVAGSQSSLIADYPATIVMGGEHSQDAHYKTNNAACYVQAGGSSALRKNSTGTLIYPESQNAVAERIQLRQSSVGHLVEHDNPDSYLGEPLVAPELTAGEEIDWAYMGTTNGIPSDQPAFYSPSAQAVYAEAGGALYLNWRISDANGVLSTQTHNYVVANSPTGRPCRIYWTDDPYNAPAVDMKGLHYKLHYNASCPALTYAVHTNQDGSVSSNMLYGIYEQNGALRVAVQDDTNAPKYVEGNIVLQYFKTGNFEEQTGVEVIEISRPQISTIPATLGSPLQPIGGGYPLDGIYANVTRMSDASGDTYVYTEDTGEKAGWVYPIRTSVTEPWNIEIYWTAPDCMGVLWPFEVDWYAADWPEQMQLFVRGDEYTDGERDYGASIHVPRTYTATVEDYQEPPDHAFISDTQTDCLTFDDNGKCLLRLSTVDNYWYVPIQSVGRYHNTFDLHARAWEIGTEIRPFESAYSVLVPRIGGQKGLSTWLTLGESFTLTGWIYTPNLESVRSGASVVFSQDVRDSSTGAFTIPVMRVQIYNADPLVNGEKASCLRAYMCTGDSEYGHLADLMSLEPLQSRTTYQVAVTYDAEQRVMRLYLNGELQQEQRWDEAAPAALSDTVCNFTVGQCSVPDNDQATAFGGLIDEVVVWTNILDSDQVYSCYNGATKAYSTNELLQAGLRALWKVDPQELSNDGTQLNATLGGVAMDIPAGVEMLPIGQIGLRVIDDYSMYHGYIYEPAGSSYNTNLYDPPRDDLDAIEEDVEGADGVADAGRDESAPNTESYIYGINTDEELEVWWANGVQQDGMEDILYIPSHVQRFRNVWPETSRKLVMASLAGSSAGDLSAVDHCVVVTDDEKSGVALKKGSYFNGDFTIEAWLYLQDEVEDICVLNFETADEETQVKLRFSSKYSDYNALYIGDVQCKAHLLLATGRWVHVAATLSGTTARLYVDGEEVASQDNMPIPSGETLHNKIAQSANCKVDEVRIWSYARTEEELQEGRFYEQNGEPGLIVNLPFKEGAGAVSMDVASGSWTWCRRVGWDTGVPKVNQRIYTEAECPSIYYQNDPLLPGYNPNEEHAYITEYEGVQTVFALQNTLNAEGESAPYVLVNYQKEDERWGMDVFEVVLTNRFHSNFLVSMTAGDKMDQPIPLTLLENAWNDRTYCSAGPGLRDRNNRWWAKASSAAGEWQYGSNYYQGVIEMHNYYPLQESFYIPQLGAAQPEVGTPVPWLPFLWNHADPLESTPRDFYIASTWPENSAQMNIGQTLTEAVNGLPDVWNQKSVSVAYEQGQTNDLVTLFDPLQAQCSTLHYSLEEYGFDLAEDVYQRNGHYYFNGLSPDIANRLYFDTTRVTNNLRFEGARVQGLTQSYLLMNVLNDHQRAEIKALASAGKEEAVDNDWAEAVASLATERVEIMPNQPFENLALCANGNGTGRVTLLFNDATNAALGVKAGDSVSMVIIEVTTNLETGVVIPIEDENNMLSEQMTMLHSLDFAGHQWQFEYDWRWHEPNANGTTPSDPLDAPKFVSGIHDTNGAWHPISTTGLYSIVIGGAADTLEDMVNRFYAVRYRAVSEDAVAACGTNWSDFTAFALSEGWVQRVLNSLTPFEQRMSGLYDNEVDLSVSMIQQAGAPYEGDVALNADSVKDVGLIQAYKTVLNTALKKGVDTNSSSVFSIEANQQLLLAATRLNDLYMLLGNEAYADAQDPMIGFGVSASPATSGAIDYGQMSTALFCFDNQLPSLLDEELALLRGTSENGLAPGTDVSPVYNRLWWNYTKGITAGEVAYTENYDIKGLTNVNIDAVTAKEKYPQGHGDAWGYYLDALSGYYDLLHNTQFSWGIPSITPMLMDDLTIDADYFDERKFAESAAALARTGKDIVSRTFRKAYTDYPDGTLFPGYSDSDTNRAWGVGEWGIRAGMGALCNWAVANSLLPLPTVWQTNAVSLELKAVRSAVELSALDTLSGDFTLECWVKLSAYSDRAELVSYSDAAHNTYVSLYVAVDSSGLHCPAVEISTESGTTKLVSDFDLSTNEWRHLAFTLSGTNGALYVSGTLVKQQEMGTLPHGVTYEENRIGQSALSAGGQSLLGGLAEVRLWSAVRGSEELAADQSIRLTGTEQGLLSYWPLNEGGGSQVRDMVTGSYGTIAGTDHIDYRWLAESPVTVSSSDFRDEGILRIDRSTVPELNELSYTAKSIQHEVDMIDEGLNPLGLSRNSVVFDISPAALDSGESHFEQILGRAEAALRNAQASFDAAAEAGKVLRQQTEAAHNYEESVTSQELAYNNRLIEYYGYPYSDDIGVGCSYPQGYVGPDLYHYMYVDMEALGGAEMELQPAIIYSVELNKDDDNGYKDPSLSSIYYDANGVLVTNDYISSGEKGDYDSDVDTNAANYLTFNWNSSGLPVIPSEWTGSRQACGKLQHSWADVMVAYMNYKHIQLDIQQQQASLEKTLKYYMNIWYPFNHKYLFWDTVNNVVKMVEQTVFFALDARNQYKSIKKKSSKSDASQAKQSSAVTAKKAAKSAVDEAEDTKTKLSAAQEEKNALVGANGTVFQPQDGSQLAQAVEALEAANEVLQQCRNANPPSADDCANEKVTVNKKQKEYDALSISANKAIEKVNTLSGTLGTLPTCAVGVKSGGSGQCKTANTTIMACSGLGVALTEIGSRTAVESYLTSCDLYNENNTNLVADTSGGTTNSAGAGNVVSQIAGGAGFSDPVVNALYGIDGALPSLASAGMAGAAVAPVMQASALVRKDEALAKDAMYKASKDITKLVKDTVKYLENMSKEIESLCKQWEKWDQSKSYELKKLSGKIKEYERRLWEFKGAFEELRDAMEVYLTVEAEAERLLQEREYTRTVAANNVAASRYRDMSFRIWRSELLEQYASSFDLAARYTYLAAKAYDYETAMLASDAVNEPGSAFCASVVKARTLGLLSEAGEPMVYDSFGEPGLADILARMKRNWGVLEGRYGFNNPDRETSKISLRSEKFRFLPGAEGDKSWHEKLESFRVDDLFDVDVFRRYCLPFTNEEGLRENEPGLVIPFSSTINFGENFFGNELAGGDHAFDSSHFATKIRSVGIWFSNYNAGVTSGAQGLSETPRVYIVPAGADAQRSPTESLGAVRYWNVMDQAIPIPYSLGVEDVETRDYIPLLDSLSGGGFTAVRRYPAMRAYPDSGTTSASEMNSSSRLVGRSVWNTQWVLIIPAGALNNDREKAMDYFINGVELDGNGVKDIKIMFETYSNAGN